MIGCPPPKPERRTCHGCRLPIGHRGMFCSSECSESFWKAQADASPRRTKQSRRLERVFAKRKASRV